MERQEKESGAKMRQRRDTEDRAIAYRQWRHGRGGRSACVCDIDQLEYRYVDGIPTPIGILEITRYDAHVEPEPSYLANIIDRYDKRDGQGKACRRWAEMLKVEAWIVLFRYSISEVGDKFYDHDFWIYELTNPEAAWHAITQAQYERFLLKLEARALGRPVWEEAADEQEKTEETPQKAVEEEDIPI